jgi:hypothetical protein
MTSDDYKKYKDLKPENKIQCLFTPEEFKQMEVDFQVIVESEKTGQIKINPKIFNSILNKIQRILVYNYIEDFFKAKHYDLLNIPNVHHKSYLEGLEYNSLGPSI